MTWRASHVGFGDPATPEAKVYFRLLRPGGELANWSTAENIQVHVIPGAFPPKVEIEVVSSGPSTVTWRLAFATREELTRLLPWKGRTATLTLLNGVQSQIGQYEQLHGRAYEHLSFTTLMALDNESTPVGGPYEVDATFLRVIDPDTGTAVMS